MEGLDENLVGEVLLELNDIHDVVHASEVSKLWRRSALADHLWHRLLLRAMDPTNHNNNNQEALQRQFAAMNEQIRDNVSNSSTLPERSWRWAGIPENFVRFGSYFDYLRYRTMMYRAPPNLNHTSLAHDIVRASHRLFEYGYENIKTLQTPLVDMLSYQKHVDEAILMHLLKGYIEKQQIQILVPLVFTGRGYKLLGAAMMDYIAKAGWQSTQPIYAFVGGVVDQDDADVANKMWRTAQKGDYYSIMGLLHMSCKSLRSDICQNITERGWMMDEYVWTLVSKLREDPDKDDYRLKLWRHVTTRVSGHHNMSGEMLALGLCGDALARSRFMMAVELDTDVLAACSTDTYLATQCLGVRIIDVYNMMLRCIQEGREWKWCLQAMEELREWRHKCPAHSALIFIAITKIMRQASNESWEELYNAVYRPSRIDTLQNAIEAWHESKKEKTAQPEDTETSKAKRAYVTKQLDKMRMASWGVRIAAKGEIENTLYSIYGQHAHT